jgi:hypothetical protein
MQTPTTRRNLDEIMEQLKSQRAQEQRDWFQRPTQPTGKVLDRNAGTDWSGAEFSGQGLYRSWGGGRER